MRKIDADALFKQITEFVRELPQKDPNEWSAAASACLTIKDMISAAPEEDGICECNLADNAALICEILNADAQGERSSLLDAEGDEDLVKVVRCKDCKYCASEGNHLKCKCKIIGKVVSADSYCECGTRE